MEKVINGLKIDPNIFYHPFVRGCDVSICGGECCNYGVYVDKTEMEYILQHKEEIKDHMDETQTKDESKWFEPLEEDSDFESGQCAGTEVFNNKCVFLDKNGYCTLQFMAYQKEKHKWTYKPLYCVLFPLTIYQKTLTIDDEHLDRMHYCNKSENHVSTVFEACKEEIRHLLGDKGFIELLEYKKECDKLKLIVLDS